MSLIGVVTQGKYDEAVAQGEKYKTQLEALQGTSEAFAAEKTALQTQLAEAITAKEKSDSDFANASKTLETLTAEKTALQTQLAEAITAKEKSEADFANATKELDVFRGAAGESTALITSEKDKGGKEGVLTITSKDKTFEENLVSSMEYLKTH